MKTYHKIETVFNRDEKGTKKLIEGSYRDKTIEFLANNDWVWTEKIDGTNIRIYWDGHKITFGGRTEDAQIPTFLFSFLSDTFLNTETEELFEQKFGENEVILFGEGYGPKIQKVGALYRDTPSFILFDVMIGDLYLERENVEDIANAFGIDIVPIIGTGTISEAIAYVKTKPNSMFGTAKIEGIVARPAVEMKNRRGNRIIVKIKVCDFC